MEKEQNFDNFTGFTPMCERCGAFMYILRGKEPPGICMDCLVSSDHCVDGSKTIKYDT